MMKNQMKVSQKHKSIRGEILSAWKILDVHLSASMPKYFFEEELVFDYYMWANRRERRYKNWVAMPTAGNKPTILRWYGANIPKDDTCALCAETNAVLDEGDAIQQFDSGDTSDINVNLDL